MPQVPPTSALPPVSDPAARRLLDLFLSDAIDAELDPHEINRRVAPDVDPRVQKAIVVVHGMGDQVRNDAALATAIRFCDFFEYRSGISLGAFHPPPGARPGLVIPAPPNVAGLTGAMAFAEAHWADIARRVAKQGYTLQETKEWARSIVHRIGEMARRKGAAPAGVDYGEIRAVLEELIDAIGVIEALLFLAKKAGLGEFDLKALLDDYLGDVQLVAEFATVRTRILGRFVNTMAAVAAKYPHAQLFVVAHSEGTVVSFLGLLEALDAPDDHDWIKRVDGYMTFGSPIDKHLILWPQLFASHTGPAKGLAVSIPWRNYVDYADPVGFDLNTARDWITDRGYAANLQFTPNDDFSFRRYAVPGKAHIDYWGDAAVFSHFIRDVVRRGAVRPEPPPTKRLVPLLSYAIAYLVPFAILLVGMYVLVSAIAQFLDPKDTESHKNFVPTWLGLASLVAGTTVWLRFIRLTRSWGWFWIGFGLYAAGAAGFWFALRWLDPRAAVNELAWFERLSLAANFPVGATSLVTSFALVLLVLLFSGRKRNS